MAASFTVFPTETTTTLPTPPPTSTPTPAPLLRAAAPPERDLAYAYQSLAIPTSEDNSDIRLKYRPFLLPEGGKAEDEDWVKGLELATVVEMAKNDLETTGERIKVLVLYGSLRARYVIYA